jgi:hypothetical protein
MNLTISYEYVHHIFFEILDQTLKKHPMDLGIFYEKTKLIGHRNQFQDFKRH